MISSRPSGPWRRLLGAARANLEAAERVLVGAGHDNPIIWTRTVESPEKRSGTWVIDFGAEDHTGRAASRALADTLRDIAEEASTAPELWRLADKVRTDRGPLRTP